MTSSCDLCLCFIAHAQNESAEAAAVQVGTSGHEAPGHTEHPSVQWAQNVLWATDHRSKQQKWSQLQLRGGDVLCLVGKPTECSQGWHLPSAFHGREAAGVCGGMRACWEAAMTSVPVYLCGEEGKDFLLSC